MSKATTTREIKPLTFEDFNWEQMTRGMWRTSSRYYCEDAELMDAMEYRLYSIGRELRYFLFFEGWMVGPRRGFKTRKGASKFLAKQENKERGCVVSK